MTTSELSCLLTSERSGAHKISLFTFPAPEPPSLLHLPSSFASPPSCLFAMANAAAAPEKPKRIPVTVLTGFLGSGKTTFVNYVLREHHGYRIAIVENEFGEVGVDDGLVLQTNEEVIEMMNGCICEFGAFV